MARETVFYIYGRNRFTGKTECRIHTLDPGKVETIKTEMRDKGLTPYAIRRKRTHSYDVYTSTSQ